MFLRPPSLEDTVASVYEVDTLLLCNDDVDSDGDVSADSWQRQDVIKHLALNAQPLAGTVYQQHCHQGHHHHHHNQHLHHGHQYHALLKREGM